MTTGLGVPIVTECRTEFEMQWLRYADMHRAMEIERASFDNPWSQDAFTDVVKHKNCIALAAWRHSDLVGFMVYQILKKSVHIISIAVHPDWRRRGAGSAMLRRLKATLRADKRDSITLAMRETNLGAQLFFRCNQFRACDVLRGYFDDTGEDAYLMAYQHTEDDDDE